MHVLIERILARPILGLYFGLPFFVAFVALAVSSYGELRAFEHGPVDSTIERAIAAAREQDAYVRIPAASLDCAQAIIDESSSPPYVYAPLRGDSGAYVGFATLDGSECVAPAEGVVGVLGTTNGRKAARLRGHLPEPALGFDLCTYCGVENSRLGVYLGGGLALASLLLYPLALYENRRRARPAAASPEVG